MTAGSQRGGTDPDAAGVSTFLGGVHDAPVTDIEPLSGGFWSSAFAYRCEDRALVVRFGEVREGFESDLAAMAYDRTDLPVPAVFAIGDAFGGSYAISERRYGRFLETVRPDEADAAGPTIVRLLRALRSVPPANVERGNELAWRDWLVAGLVDDPTQRVGGWRATLAEDPELDRLFRACEVQVQRLAGACPERRDLVHGDLLHANVLVDDDVHRVTAVFSWKCSVRGDFLFDAAWCTFWGAFHPGIAAADVWTRVVRDVDARDDIALLFDAAERHHCYELQIGASHLGWYAWTGDATGLQAAASHTAEVLERGPLPMPRPPTA